MDEETKKRSLHAAIFGDESDSEDEDLPSLSRPVDDKVQKILAAAKEKKQTAAKKDKGKGKARAKGGDAAPPRKRLKKAGPAGDGAGGAEGSSGAGTAAEGDDEGAGVADGGFREDGEAGAAPVYDSEDSEAEGGGMEAVEAGGKHDLDNILQKMKGRRGQIVRSREMLVQEVLALQQQMEASAERDDDACRSGGGEPAVNKVALLPAVIRMLGKRHLHEVMIDQGMLTTLAMWLKPMPDGSLVSLQVRTDLLRALAILEVDETVLGSLRSSGLGKYVRLYSLHKKENPPNRRLALALVEKWKRPIFGSSMAYSVAEVPALEGRSATELLAKAEARLAAPPEEVDEVGATRRKEGKTQNGTRVPRPIGMDFKAQPVAKVSLLPSARYTKESTKGRLQEKMAGAKKKKGTSSQAMTVSLEGRGLDKL